MENRVFILTYYNDCGIIIIVISLGGVYMALLTVGGVELREPSKYDITYKDLDSDNSYTSETGILNRDMIRSNQHTISVGWDRLTADEMKTILQAVSGKSEFQLTYFDYYTMSYQTGRFYANDRQGVGKRVRKIRGLFSLSFNITEF